MKLLFLDEKMDEQNNTLQILPLRYTRPPHQRCPFGRKWLMHRKCTVAYKAKGVFDRSWLWANAQDLKMWQWHLQIQSCNTVRVAYWIKKYSIAPFFFHVILYIFLKWQLLYLLFQLSFTWQTFNKTTVVHRSSPYIKILLYFSDIVFAEKKNSNSYIKTLKMAPPPPPLPPPSSKNEYEYQNIRHFTSSTDGHEISPTSSFNITARDWSSKLFVMSQIRLVVPAS